MNNKENTINIPFPSSSITSKQRNLSCLRLNEQSPIVKLNVGGLRYMTTLSTLTARGENHLSTLVHHCRQGHMSSTIDEEGYYFVDRNGRLFEYVLDYLRNGVLVAPMGVSMECMYRELDFYTIPYRKEDIVETTSPSKNKEGLKRTTKFIDEIKQVEPRLSSIAEEFLKLFWPQIFESIRLAAAEGGKAVTVTWKSSRKQPNEWHCKAFEGLPYEKFSSTDLLLEFAYCVSNAISYYYGFDSYIKKYFIDEKVKANDTIEPELQLHIRWMEESALVRQSLSTFMECIRKPDSTFPVLRVMAYSPQ